MRHALAGRNVLGGKRNRAKRRMASQSLMEWPDIFNDQNTCEASQLSFKHKTKFYNIVGFNPSGQDFEKKKAILALPVSGLSAVPVRVSAPRF